MSLHCHFNSCQWCGAEADIFDHVETQHKKYLKEPKGKLFFDFSFGDLQQECFVVCSQEGLYWFRQNCHQKRDDGIDFDVFHIGESEPVEYNLKLGLKSEGHCEYWGPYKSKPDDMLSSNTADEYNLKFDFEFLEVVNETMPSRRLRLYFGEFDDSDDRLCPNPEDIDWEAEDEPFNQWAVEKFTCGVCYEYIRRDVRFCENKHFICLQCFNKMHQRKQLKCPICRREYLQDCESSDLDRLLRMIKWPDTPVPQADTELMGFLESLPKYSVVKVKPGESA